MGFKWVENGRRFSLISPAICLPNSAPPHLLTGFEGVLLLKEGNGKKREGGRGRKGRKGVRGVRGKKGKKGCVVAFEGNGRPWCQRQRCSPRSVVSGDKSYADIRRCSLVRWCQMRMRSSKMRVFSVDRYTFLMKFPSGFTYRNLYGFARFPCDSTALVVFVSVFGVDFNIQF